MTGELVAPPPNITPEAANFWAATAEGRFLVGHCPECEAWFWPPNRGFCPGNGHPAGLKEASGLGTLYSWTVIHRGSGPYAAAGSYVLAYVELEEGPTMLTNLIDVDPEAIEIGMALRVALVPTGAAGSPALPRFRPLAPEA
jgi:uncharacterized OB-fold protein